MKILFTSNEATPIYKLGGLGDVSGSLPPALTDLDLDIRLAIPKHAEIHMSPDWVLVSQFQVSYKHLKESVKVFQGFLPNTKTPIYFFENHNYLSTSTDALDDHANKYAFFSLSIAHWLSTQSSNWQPDIIHLNDWHTALIPIILKHKYHKRFKTLLTIHNLAYQAITSEPIDTHLHLPKTACQILEWDKTDHQINILMEGILHADAVSTVSPNYANEITTPQYGEKLDDFFKGKSLKISGILNGIRYEEFHPSTDPHLYKTYDKKTYKDGKAINKKELLRDLNLKNFTDKPLYAFIGRVDTYQKGIDIIIDSVKSNTVIPQNAAFLFLGTGEEQAEKKLHDAASASANIKIITRFDEPLARKIYAAADYLLIPSRYEPCGLIQLIAMTYGTIPIAHETGGLSDTIVHNKTGYLFKPLTIDNFAAAINHAQDAFSSRDTLIKNCMNQDFGWTNSAKEYKNLYQQIGNTN